MYFGAKIDDASIVFALDKQKGSKQNGLYAAVALSKLEPEIEFVENIFSRQLDFNLNETPQLKNSLSLRGMSSEGARLVMDLPLEKLQSIDSSDGISVPGGLEWQSMNSQFTLSHVKLTPQDLGAIQKDSILLIPDSFQPDWLIEINIESMDRKLCAKLNLDKRVCCISDERLPACESGSNIEAVESVSICVEELVQLSAEPLINKSEFHLPSNITDLNWLVVDKSGVRASGVPTKIGDGYGLLITRVML